MNCDIKTKNKHIITMLILLGVSILLFALQQPILKYLILIGKEIERPHQSFSVFGLFTIVRTVLIVISVFLIKNKKAFVYLFATAMGLAIISQIVSLTNTISLITVYSNNFNADTNLWLIPVLRQNYINLFINILYLLIYAFLFIDIVMKHRFIKITKIIMLIFFVLSLVSMIGNFTSNSVLYAITLCSGLFLSLAMLVYYWLIAENNHTMKLEEELQRLKNDFDNGLITTEEYAAKKEAVLKRL